MGKQVADNTEMQHSTTLKVNDSGKFYVETKEQAKRGLIKSEYVPVGMTLVYPKEWGKQKGSLHLLNHYIKEQESIIKQAEVNLEGLQTLKEGIERVGID